MIESYHDLVRRDVFDLIPDSAGRTLDFGGGIGATSCTLKVEGRADYVVLFDQMAKEAATGVDAALSLDLEDANALAGALATHGPFDCILALDVLEHLRDPWTIIELLDRVLTPGGSLVISLPNMAHFSVLFSLIRGRFDYQSAGIMDRTHLRWFTLKTARELATHSGLILRETGLNYSGRKYRYLAKGSFGLLNRFCATQIKMRVEKPDQGLSI